MKLRAALMLVLTVSAGSGASHARPLPAPAAAAAIYWTCPAGFNLERNGASLVRCRKPASEDITYPKQQIAINQGKP